MRKILIGIILTLVVLFTFKYCGDRNKEQTILKENSALIQEQLKNVSKLVVTEGHFSEVFTYEKQINKGHSSSKKMRIGDKETVDKMIAQHKIDLKSKAGKHNTLTIWEVYDTSKFLRFKRHNPNYATLKKADCFNTDPFYKSEGS